MQLRRAETADAMAVARVHVRSGQAAYSKLMPDDFLDQLRPEDRAKRYDFGNLDPIRPQCGLRNIPALLRRRGANLLYCRSPLFLVPLSTSITWERTPHPVRRPAFSSHLISSTMGHS